MSKRKSRMGRPRLPKGAVKAAMLCVRLSPTERDAVERAAQAKGIGASQFARELLMLAARSFIQPET